MSIQVSRCPASSRELYLPLMADPGSFFPVFRRPHASMSEPTTQVA